LAIRGSINRAINLVADNVLFVSSAGNAGSRKHGTSGTWEGNFVDGGPNPKVGTGRLQQFNGKPFLTLTRRTDRIGLFWNDPWYNSTNKYSLHVNVRRGDVSILVSSIASYYPFQAVVAGNTPGVLSFEPGDRIYVMKENGSQPRYLHLDTDRGEIDVGTSGSIRGHAAAQNVLAVAAVPVPKPAADGRPQPFVGGSKVEVEAQSSDGPRRMFFYWDDTPMPTTAAAPPTDVDLHIGAHPPPSSRNATESPSIGGGRLFLKPDLAAASHVKTTLPPGTPSNPTGLNPFDGTSAAAPHVAGIAALILSLRPDLTPAQVRHILIASTVDIDYANRKPGSSLGRYPPDEVAGWGIPMADKALALAAAGKNPVSRLSQAELEAARIGVHRRDAFRVKSLSVGDQIFAALEEDKSGHGNDYVFVKIRNQPAYDYGKIPNKPGYDYGGQALTVPRVESFGTPVDVIVDGRSVWVLYAEGRIRNWTWDGLRRYPSLNCPAAGCL
jgi:subtilisin family serine protease